MTRILKRVGAVICVLMSCLSGLLAHPALAQSATDAAHATSKIWRDDAVILRASVPVNSADAPVQLTREQLWQGLVMRARAPGTFVPALKACHILQDGPIAIVRACTYKGMSFEDLVTLFPMKRIRFQSLDYPANHSLVENLIEGHGDDSLVLRFRFVFRGGTQEKTENFREAFTELAEEEFALAVTRTLARIRELAVAGELPTSSHGPKANSRKAESFIWAHEAIAQSATDGQTVRLPPALVQPIELDYVAAALADVAVGAPVSGTVEVSGPELFPLDKLAREVLAANDDGRQVIADVHARYFGAELNDQSLTPVTTRALRRPNSRNGSVALWRRDKSAGQGR